MRCFNEGCLVLVGKDIVELDAGGCHFEPYPPCDLTDLDLFPNSRGFKATAEPSFESLVSLERVKRRRGYVFFSPSGDYITNRLDFQRDSAEFQTPYLANMICPKSRS